ncbi:MAG: helix-turn-helix domain-containing protein [Actinomycetota bacterium]|nr:helix-turn-helix domain-containing protein [Actinomycetota bacterium]
MRRDMFSIGEFSRVSRMSVKTLRFYDEHGLLRPGHIDPGSGYRYYSSVQLGEANLIRLLRSLELPLEDIQSFLRLREGEERRSLLERHRTRIEERLEGYRSVISSIERMIGSEDRGMKRHVEVKEVVEQDALSTRFLTSLDTLTECFTKAFEKIPPLLRERSQNPVGPPCTPYYGEEFDESDIDMEVCIPVGRVMGEGGCNGEAASRWENGLHPAHGPLSRVGRGLPGPEPAGKGTGLPLHRARPGDLSGIPRHGGNDADLRMEILFPIGEPE